LNGKIVFFLSILLLIQIRENIIFEGLPKSFDFKQCTTYKYTYSPDNILRGGKNVCPLSAKNQGVR